MKVSVAQIYFVALVGVITVILLGYSNTFKPLNELFEHCWTGSVQSGGWLQRLRGGNYWISVTEDQRIKRSSRYCLMTTWAITHIVLYAIIGFLFPTLFWPTFMIGVAYEVMEWITFDCHDVLDLVWNSIGFLIGASIRTFLV
jgi:hypothetical protein